MATLTEILPRLINSLRGRIFLCNLGAALSARMIDRGKLRAALLGTLETRSLLVSEDSLLGQLRRGLQRCDTELWLQRELQGIPPEFSHDASVVSVITLEDYYGYYSDKKLDAYGHDYPDSAYAATLPSGWVSSRFRSDAGNAYHFWVAPSAALPKPLCAPHAAQKVRDLLGLVHRGANVPLVAIFLRPPERHSCFRPTVVEALPNARFLQVHPHETEQRWGYTVDLEKLDALGSFAAAEESASRLSISGLPELVLAELLLRDCSDVKFIALGSTYTDRATQSADTRFSKYVEGDAGFDKIYQEIEAVLQPERLE